jgi:hypothetical protein
MRQTTTISNVTAHTATVATNAIRNGFSFLSSIRTGFYVRMVLIGSSQQLLEHIVDLFAVIAATGRQILGPTVHFLRDQDLQ